MVKYFISLGSFTRELIFLEDKYPEVLTEFISALHTVNPLCHCVGYVTLYRECSSRPPHHPVDANKVLGRLGPLGQLHVGYVYVLLIAAQLVAVGVHKHVRQVVELWDQLLYNGQYTLVNWQCWMVLTVGATLTYQGIAHYRPRRPNMMHCGNEIVRVST